jgi:hypothetical protein
MKIRNSLKSMCLLAGFVLSPVAFSELQAIDDEELGEAVAQGGLYLSGEFSLNEDGGPISNSVYGNPTRPSDSEKKYGARFAYKTGANEGHGWRVIDEWRGGLSFEGLTIRTRRVDGNLRDVTGVLVDQNGVPVSDANAIALGANDGFGGDGAAFDKEVLEVGLPSTVRFKDYQYTVGYASHASEAAASAVGGTFKQTNLYGVYIDGQVNMSGNMLIFPTADK